MSISKLMLGLALAGLTLSGCNKEDNTKPVSTPNPPTSAHSRQVPSTEPSATGGSDTAIPATGPAIALPPVIPGAGGPVTQPSTRPTGSSGSGTGSSGSSGSGTGSGGASGGGSDLNK
jgi:hypothetical protein